MPRKRSSTKATGGKGFTFADKVAGGFLVQMLARTFPMRTHTERSPRFISRLRNLEEALMISILCFKEVLKRPAGRSR